MFEITTFNTGFKLKFPNTYGENINHEYTPSENGHWIKTKV